MQAEIVTLVKDIEEALELIRRHLDWNVAFKRLEELNALSEDPELWSNPTKAQKLMQERSFLDTQISEVNALETGLLENIELLELAQLEGDTSLVQDAQKALVELGKKASKRQLESLLCGEVDSHDTFLEIHAGAGGTESQDWASMILRMYTRWALAHGYETALIEESPGEEAGFKSATIKIKGRNAYGWLKTETGVHRLVRISPFDSNARRHTSFCSVSVYPVVDDSIDIDINPSELRIDTYRASGAGGQHINKTDSAVRITHLPTGIVVQCQNDRSQHRNRATAYSMLKARLYERELEKRESLEKSSYDSKTEIGWGHQIRSYVLHPYQMVKDLRTSIEKGNAKAVLDGDLDDFLEATLSYKINTQETHPQKV